MKYVKSLMGSKLRGRKVTEEDIGIIAPYRKQVSCEYEKVMRKVFGISGSGR